MRANSKDSPALKRYYERMSDKHMTPLWTIMSDAVPDEPSPKFQATLWDYEADIRPALMEASTLISAEEAQRRVLVLNNPSLPRGATHTLFCAVQLIRNGEVAPPHRHTQSALRLVIEGSGAYTAINGEKTSMSPGDFIITPAWTWHEHGKETEGEMIWVDGLDIPFVNHLGATFGEEPNGTSTSSLLRPGDSEVRYGAGLLPVDAPIAARHSPLLRYPYERSREVLEKLRASDLLDPSHGVRLKFANPLNGDYVLPTIAVHIQMLPKAFRSVPYRSTEGAVFVVIEGKAIAKIADRTYPLKKNDVFVVPNWTWYEFDVEADTILFSYSDRAILEKVGLWREQRGNVSSSTWLV